MASTRKHGKIHTHTQAGSYSSEITDPGPWGRVGYQAPQLSEQFLVPSGMKMRAFEQTAALCLGTRIRTSFIHPENAVDGIPSLLWFGSGAYLPSRFWTYTWSLALGDPSFEKELSISGSRLQ